MSPSLRHHFLSSLIERASGGDIGEGILLSFRPIFFLFEGIGITIYELCYLMLSQRLAVMILISSNL